MGPSFELGSVDVFTGGAVGPPGQRVFYLQARRGREVVTFKCEKQQVAVLGASLGNLLADLPEPSDAPLPTALELLEPVEPVWTVGQMVLGFDASRAMFVVELVELTDDDTPDDERATASVELTTGQANAFALRANDLVAAGRPSCRFCGNPIDPDGHPCPRMN